MEGQGVRVVLWAWLRRETTANSNSRQVWRTFLQLFYARQLYRQVLLRARISYGNSVRPSVCPSVCPSVLVSRPGTESRPGQIETPGFHPMIA